MIIRSETPEDIQSIRYITTKAFGRADEAKLIEALRNNNKVILSLLALQDEQPIGHILFFPVVIETESENYPAIGLGPMAVLPEFQTQGIGSALVRAGLDELKQNGHDAVIVLGHPEFYPRFGFAAASTYGINSKYDVPDDFFMALELLPKGLANKSGTVIYSAEFNEV